MVGYENDFGTLSREFPLIFDTELVATHAVVAQTSRQTAIAARHYRARRLGRIVVACVFVTGILRSPAWGGDVLVRDGFAAEKIDPAWVVTYQAREVRPGLRQVSGLLLARHSVVWHRSSPEITLSRDGQGVRLAADLFFYPRPGFEWQQTSNPYPLGFQNDTQGGVGTTYARFSLVDGDGDRYTDTIRFETGSGDGRLATDLAGYNPATNQEFHRFAIDWRPEVITAYFDGKPFARHEIAIAGPLCVASRNEYVNALVDNLELIRLDADSGPPRTVAALTTRDSRARRPRSAHLARQAALPRVQGRHVAIRRHRRAGGRRRLPVGQGVLRHARSAHPRDSELSMGEL